jgi:hypothetical protein
MSDFKIGDYVIAPSKHIGVISEIISLNTVRVYFDAGQKVDYEISDLTHVKNCPPYTPQMKRISFDFDGTLSEPHIQAVAKRAIQDGHKVYITTARFKHSAFPFINKDLHQIAESIGISPTRIRFTDGTEKNQWLHDFDIHFDDCHLQLQSIKETNPTITCIWCRDDKHLQEITESTFEKTESGILLISKG